MNNPFEQKMNTSEESESRAETDVLEAAPEIKTISKEEIKEIRTGDASATEVGLKEAREAIKGESLTKTEVKEQTEAEAEKQKFLSIAKEVLAKMKERAAIKKKGAFFGALKPSPREIASVDEAIDFVEGEINAGKLPNLASAINRAGLSVDVPEEYPKKINSKNLQMGGNGGGINW
ncbi:MAG: hypothetical protein WC458_01815 [Patescibacteria group bacterium]